MAIKISNTDVIDNSRKGIFASANLGSYTPANRPGTAVAGDAIYNSTLESIEYWTGTTWIPLSDVPISATGGAEFTPGDGYKYHVFTSSTDFTISSGAGLIQTLIVAGGGGGGAGREAGGGGAGGLRVISVGKRASGTYPIVVGGGGGGMPYWPGYPLGAPHSSGTRGSSSSAFGFTSTGGGAQDGPLGPAGTGPGGSGAGSDANTTSISFPGNAPPVTPSQGNPGGAGAFTYPGPEPGFNCGGGGGAGAAGGNAGTGPGSTRGPGGIGKPSSNLSDVTPAVWNIPTSYGTTGPQPGRYFSGGGGGAGGTFAGTPPGGTGGSGGGGSAPAGAGTVNTGGGGAGGYFYLDQNYAGGSGGSGIVIVRYRV